MIAFQQPWYLLGLLGLAVPVLLHMINRELARPLEFSSIRFLRRTSLPRRERRRLRDLLLLLLRLLFFALLVLGFARPYWKADTALVDAGDVAPLDYYLVDASWSMGRPGIHEALDAAILEQVEQGGDTVLAASVYADKELAYLAPGAAGVTVRQMVDRQEVEMAAGRPDVALEAVLQRLQGYAGVVTLHVFSDFQETDWLRELPELPSDWQVVAHPVVGEPVANTSITGVRCFPVGNDLQRVQVWLRQSGPKRAIRLVLEDKDGSVIESRDIRLERDEDYQLFDVSAQEARACRVRIEGDGYEGDNEYVFWVPTSPQIKVLALLPNFDEPASANAFYFLQTALEVKSEVDWLSFDVEAFDRAFLDPDVLAKADMVIIPASAAYFKDYDWELVGEYAQGGGKLWFLPGDDFPKQFRALIDHGFLEGRFVGLVGQVNERQQPFHPELPKNGGLSEVFRGDAARDLLLSQIYQYVKLRGVPAEDVWMTQEDGDPLIITRAYGQGRVWINTFAMDTRWGDLPLRNAFLPLVRELVQQGYDAQSNYFSHALGETDASMLSLIPFKPNWIEEEGQYHVFNIASSEYAVACVDAQACLNALSGGPASGTAERIADGSGAQTKDLSWWYWLLLAAMACLVFETLLAARDGRGYRLTDAS